MKQVGKRSAGKNIVFTVLTIFILWLVVEIVLSVFFFHRYSDEKLASIEALKIGKAALQGRPNFTLLDFKLNLGAIPTHKLTFEKSLP